MYLKHEERDIISEILTGIVNNSPLFAMSEKMILKTLLNNLDFVFGLIIGLMGTVYSWHQRKIELKAKLYYPLFLACYNLIFIFDEIENIRNDEEQGRELYNSAVKHLDDIMNSFGTSINLRNDSKNVGKNYLNIFFKVKRIVDLNHASTNKNWSNATIWFENAKSRKYDGKDLSRLNKIKEFEELHGNLLKLKSYCETHEASLRGQTL